MTGLGHIHDWHADPARDPWMRTCACGAEGHLVGGVVVELGVPGAPVEGVKKGRR